MDQDGWEDAISPEKEVLGWKRFYLAELDQSIYIRLPCSLEPSLTASTRAEGFKEIIVLTLEGWNSAQFDDKFHYRFGTPLPEYNKVQQELQAIQSFYTSVLQRAWLHKRGDTRSYY